MHSTPLHRSKASCKSTGQLASNYGCLAGLPHSSYTDLTVPGNKQPGNKHKQCTHWQCLASSWLFQMVISSTAKNNMEAYTTPLESFRETGTWGEDLKKGQLNWLDCSSVREYLINPLSMLSLEPAYLLVTGKVYPKFTKSCL